MPSSERTAKSGFRLAVRIVIFLIPLVVLAGVVDGLLLSGLRSVKTGDYGVWNRMMAGQIDADILISGSSRALVHFNSEIIRDRVGGRSCFNIGLDGSPLNLQLPYLETYLKYNQAPSVLVQGLDITCFKVLKEIHNPQMYLPYLREDRLYDNLVSLDPVFWKYRHLPLYGIARSDWYYRELALYGLLDIPQSEDRFLGFTPVDKAWGDDFDKFRTTHPTGMEYPIDPRAVNDLRRIVGLMREKGSQVILVYSPEYAENYAMTTNRDQIIATFREIASDFDVPFWDYTGDEICRDRRNFYNSQHLNAAGADLFSRSFAQRLADYLKQTEDRPREDNPQKLSY